MVVDPAQIEQTASGALPVLARILLVTDFSPCSEVAVPVARLLAESYGGTVTAAHVILRDEDPGPNEAVVGTAEEIAALAEEQMTAFLANNRLWGAGSIITSGSFEEAIATLVKEAGFDAVVVGTHGRTGVGKIMLGSVAQRIFNSAPCPVATVSLKARMSAWMGTKLNKILYATDLSEVSKRALPYALSLAKANQAELLLVHSPDESAQEEGRNHDLAELIPRADRSWCQFSQTAVAGEGAFGIVRLAENQAVDLIVIGAEQLSAGPLHRINVPFTTAYQIVANAPCPVLRVRSGALE
ncbi:MAG TPA: universal stress protein [Candidatus Bathyarchaeia archaeon]|nr:universal stress protein [Candidatus Bathyarchaeia archaeon]